MTLDSWQGCEVFLGDRDSEQWIHFVSQNTPEYLQNHDLNMYKAKYNL